MNVLGVILARAGSAGLQNKHLLPLLGRAVISYTFDHAQASTLLTRTVVSSDCRHVRALASRAGFQSIDRPWDLVTNNARALQQDERHWRTNHEVARVDRLSVQGPAERLLAVGDLLSIDAGCSWEGWHADSAFSIHVGEPPSMDEVDLIAAAEDAMWAAQASNVPTAAYSANRHWLAVAGLVARNTPPRW